MNIETLILKKHTNCFKIPRISKFSAVLFSKILLLLLTNPELEERIRPFRNGKDLTANPRGVMLIDMFGLSEAEVRTRFPEVISVLIKISVLFTPQAKN